MSLQDILDDITDAVVIINDIGEHVYSNKSASKFGLSEGVEHLTSSEFRNTLSMVIEKKIKLPVIINLGSDSDLVQACKVKISEQYRTYIISFSAFNV